jgi:ribosome hibernation promoting factor
MDVTFTGRGLGVSDAVRETAEHKLAAISRLEPRVTRIDLEFISEHHPRHDGTTRIEAAVHVPRKTFRAEAEAVDVPTALDRVVDRLERQIRDHHGKRRKRMARPDALDSAALAADAVDSAEDQP